MADEIEVLFAELIPDDGTQYKIERPNNEIIQDKTIAEIPINQDLLKGYIADPDLFNRDVAGGFFSEIQEAAYRKAIASADINDQLTNQGETVTNSKTLVKVNTSGGVRKSIEVAGFVQPLLLSLVVSSIGLLYVGYLYLMI